MADSCNQVPCPVHPPTTHTTHTTHAYSTLHTAHTALTLPPSSFDQGLDPASRRNLWDVVKSNKAGRSIILTTHSMEEAEMLCDRLGIFVDGQLVCIGNPKEITSRYAGGRCDAHKHMRHDNYVEQCR